MRSSIEIVTELNKNIDKSDSPDKNSSLISYSILEILLDIRDGLNKEKEEEININD